MTTYRKHSYSVLEQFQDYATFAESVGGIESFLALAQKPPIHAAFRQFIIYHKGDLVDTLSTKLSHLKPYFELVNSKGGVFKLEIKKQDRNISGLFSIIPSSMPNIFRIVTISYSDFWASGIRRLVRKFYPDAMPIFFKQNEVHTAFRSFEDALGPKYRVTIADATMKGRRDKAFDTERHWTELSVNEIFDTALERVLWFTSLKFLIQQQIGHSEKFKTVSSGRLYKNGQIFYDLFHTEISTYIISTLEKFAYERFLLFENRGIRERNYQSGFPLEITYGDDIFSDVSEIRRFGKVISHYPNSTKAIYHGNPYYHASIADFLDGSSFELWILSPSRIILVPQAKSSSQALERLATFIFSEFREGIIDEYKGD